MSSKISVIMPVYNEEKYLKESIESILEQTFTDFEFIIIDDGSTDGSEKIIKSYSDQRIKYIYSKNKGMVYQFNFGISIAHSELIARMDGDDIADPKRFEKQYKFLESHPDIHVVGSNAFFLAEKGKVLCEHRYPEENEQIEFMMPIESAVCHPTVIIRKEVLNQVGGYNTEFDYAADHDLFLRLLLNHYNFHNIQEPLLNYRVRWLRSDAARIGNSNELSYKLGMDYLDIIESSLSKKTTFNYNFRKGLIEYYRGSIVKSRTLFLKCLGISRKNFLSVFRYLLMSLLGDRIIKFLRRTNALPYLSLYINKFFRIDFHQIKPAIFDEK